MTTVREDDLGSCTTTSIWYSDWRGIPCNITAYMTAITDEDLGLRTAIGTITNTTTCTASRQLFIQHHCLHDYHHCLHDYHHCLHDYHHWWGHRSKHGCQCSYRHGFPYNITSYVTTFTEDLGSPTADVAFTRRYSSISSIVGEPKEHFRKDLLAAVQHNSSPVHRCIPRWLWSSEEGTNQCAGRLWSIQYTIGSTSWIMPTSQ